ncbi:hypothetical protein TZ53_23600 (plasmid) [Sphingobium sp. YBL2]|nr:hypothetical protein TZ53_23600 [Sphingobium sp. YBL2]
MVNEKSVSASCAAALSQDLWRHKSSVRGSYSSGYTALGNDGRSGRTATQSEIRPLDASWFLTLAPDATQGVRAPRRW